MKFYSQFGEDEYIVKVLPETGRFLDIGAWNAATFSNTRALFELGWTGVMIEPSPGPFLSLMVACIDCGRTPGIRVSDHLGESCPYCGGGVRYGEDPRLTLILGAVGVSDGLIHLHITDDALSTPSDKLADFAGQSYTGRYYARVWSPKIRLDRLFVQFGSGFDFVNIDTEGTSTEIFFNLLRQRIGASCICVEKTDIPPRRIISAARAYGYGVGLETDANLVLVKKSILSAEKTPQTTPEPMPVPVPEPEPVEESCTPST